jgi:signal transduction histidine kinase
VSASLRSRPVAFGFTATGIALQPRGRYVLGVLLLAASYYGAAHAGYALGFAGPVAAIMWLPVGVGIAFLYVAGPRFWPGVVAGDLLANNYSTLPLGSAVGQSVGNLLEVLVAALLMRRLVNRDSSIGTLRGLTTTLVAVAAGTLVSATIGTLSLWFGHVVSTGAMATVWRTWWLGDASGALVVVPLVLAWSTPRRTFWPGASALEATLMLCTVAGLSEIAMRGGGSLTYIVFPALIWSAVRFGQRGATLAITLAASFAVWQRTHFLGAFVHHAIDRDDLRTQLYIAVAALSTLFLGALVSERAEFAARLTASRRRLVHATDAERRRIERNLHDGAQGRLVALLVRLGVATERVSQAPETAPAVLEQARSELSVAVEELRQLSHGIQPTMLTQFGLATAIAHLTARFDTPAEVLEVPAERLDEAVEANAYFVVAEALTNAQKHARANSIQVRARTKPGALSIEVSDDGVGGAEPDGSGLQGLRDRVEAIGGTFEVHSALGRGTRIVAVLPTAVSAD